MIFKCDYINFDTKELDYISLLLFTTDDQTCLITSLSVKPLGNMEQNSNTTGDRTGVRQIIDGSKSYFCTKSCQSILLHLINLVQINRPIDRSTGRWICSPVYTPSVWRQWQCPTFSGALIDPNPKRP